MNTCSRCGYTDPRVAAEKFIASVITINRKHGGSVVSASVIETATREVERAIISMLPSNPKTDVKRPGWMTDDAVQFAEDTETIK